MVIQEMTEQECRAMLAGTDVARLACARNNQPYVVPIHVDLDGEYLYGYATLGQKIEWMRQNPRAVRPDFPSDRERDEDFEHHLTLKSRLDRAAHAFSRS